MRHIELREAFTLRDPTGQYFRASLKELTPTASPTAGLAIPYEQMPRSPEPTVEITLACSILARQRMIFVMQKATELGVSRIVPLLTDHSVPVEGLDHERAGSWPSQVVRAAKQCRRASLPHLLTPTTLDAFLTSPDFQSADICMMLDDRTPSSPPPTAPPTIPPRHIVLLVGPEGGFSDTERSLLANQTHPKKIHTWFLGGRILRAETAVLVGLTATQLLWGDFAQ
jgi:16S rRNA (uracil1498-N3)-methyltransferase